MKKILIVLLAINIVFFLWRLSANSANDYILKRDDAFSTKDDFGNIVLMSEISQGVGNWNDEFYRIAPTANAGESENSDVSDLSEPATDANSIAELVEIDQVSDETGANVTESLVPKAKENQTEIAAINDGKTVVSPTSPELEPTISDIVNEQLEAEFEDKPVLSPNGNVDRNGDTNSDSGEGLTLSEHACYRLGPIATGEEAEQWQQVLAEQASWMELKANTEKVQEGFLVLYPAADSFEHSKSNLTMLKDKGIDDIWLFTKGELRGAISLGIFKSKLRTTKVVEQFRDKDIIVEAHPWLVEKERYYLSIRTPESRANLQGRVAHLESMTAEFEILFADNCGPSEADPILAN